MCGFDTLPTGVEDEDIFEVGDGAPATLDPHDEQNRAPSGSDVPQWMQNIAQGRGNAGQNIRRQEALLRPLLVLVVSAGLVEPPCTERPAAFAVACSSLSLLDYTKLLAGQEIMQLHEKYYPINVVLPCVFAWTGSGVEKSEFDGT